MRDKTKQFTTQLKSVVKLPHYKKTKLTVLSSIYRPAGLRTQTGPSGVSCQAAGCEVCTPSRKAGSQTFPESQRSQVDCSLPGNLKDRTVGSQSIFSRTNTQEKLVLFDRAQRDHP